MKHETVKTGGKIDFVGGDHFHVWLTGCKGSALDDGRALAEILNNAVESAGLETLGCSHHSFDGGGASANVLLSESHLTAHTWPEKDGLILVDISTCNHRLDNRHKAESCLSIIESKLGAKQIFRDQMGYNPRISEPRAPGQGIWVEAKESLLDITSEYQRIQIIDTEGLGRTLVIDGLLQVSEGDEEFYHEPLVYPALLGSKNPADVLIIGGGDGGAVRHTLTYPGVKSVDLVEIDKLVIDSAKKYLTNIHRNAFDDPRVKIHIADAFDYLAGLKEKKDVIILDITDPVGPCEKLFTVKFMSMVADSLKPDGLASVHLGFPICWPTASRIAYDAVCEAFNKNAAVYSSHVPLYGSLMCFAMMSAGASVHDIVKLLPERLEALNLDGLEIVTPETIPALFALAPRVKKVFGL